MTYYIFLEKGKLNGAGQCRQLTEGVENLEVSEDVYNNFISTPTKYTYKNNQIVLNENYNKEQADLKRTYLKEKINYSLKSKYAYTGVKFDYNNEEVVFQTDKESITMINSFLVKILSGTLTKVDNWKCRKNTEPFEPVSVNFTIEQFQKIVNFGDIMVQQAFLVESQINTQIDNLSIEQLNNELFVNEFETNIKNAYTTVNTKINDLFTATIIE